MAVTLVLENGSGLANSNSYTSSAEADVYWANRNNTTWAALSADAKAAALIQATQYLDTNYRWLGTILTATQALGWPRNVQYDREGRTISGVPAAVKAATSELALTASAGSLFSSSTSAGGLKSEKVGPLEVTYQDDAASDTDTLGYIRQILAGLGRTRGGNLLRLGRV